jgi:hypothetical protein
MAQNNSAVYCGLNKAQSLRIDPRYLFQLEADKESLGAGTDGFPFANVKLSATYFLFGR